MPEQSQAELEYARRIVQTWLTKRSTSQRVLAQSADVSTSSVSRFLNGASLEIGSVMRLYSVMRDRLSTADRQAFLRTTGLSSLTVASPIDPLTQNRPDPADREDSTPDWETARRIVADFLTERDQSLRQLSAQAQLNPSILSRFLAEDTILDASSCLKISGALSAVSGQTQQVFLEATGLHLFAKTILRDIKMADASQANIEHHAKQLLMQGDDFVTQYFYSDAIKAYRQAEDITRSYSNLSIKAVTKIAVAYNEAGYYDYANEVLHSMFQAQKDIDVPEDKARMYRVLGCISFAQKNYREAEEWFNQCIEVAKEVGYEPLAETAVHFLGCIYFALGRTAANHARRALLHKADVFFDKALVLHRMYSPDYAAYDLFRKSQMHTYSGDVRGGKKLRTQARQLFGGDLSFLAVDLEEARIALREGSVDIARRNLNEIIAGWAAVEHFKEMALPLRLLGESENQDGYPDRALPLFVASLCIYPFADVSQNRKTWEIIGSACTLVARQSGQTKLRRVVTQIQEALAAQKGYFSSLNDVSQGHELAIRKIMEKLATYI